MLFGSFTLTHLLYLVTSIGWTLVLSGIVALQRAHHLCVIAVIGSEKVGTDQQHHYVCRLQVEIDHTLPLGTSTDLSIVPQSDHLVAL